MPSLLPGTIGFQHALCRPQGMPTLDTTDPINASCVACFVPGASLFDLTGLSGSGVPSGAPALVSSALGNTYAFTGSTTQYIGSVPALNRFPWTTGASWSAWIMGNAAPSTSIFTNPINSGYSLGSGSDDGFGTWWDRQDNYLAGIYFRSNAGTYYPIKPPTPPGGGIWVPVLGVWNPATNTLIEYLNGVDVASTTTSGTKPYFATDGATLFGWPRVGAGNSAFGGAVDAIRLWNRPLRPDEALRLSQDPWAGLIFAADRIAEQLSHGASTGSSSHPNFPLTGVGMLSPSKALVIGAGAMALRTVRDNPKMTRRRLLTGGLFATSDRPNGHRRR